MIKFALLALAAGLLLVQANPVPEQEEEDTRITRGPEECVNSIQAKLSALVIPEDVKSYVEQVKELNGPVYNEVNSLIKMVESKQFQSDVYGVGIVTEDSAETLADSCTSLVIKMIEESKAPGCKDLAELNEGEFAAYSKIMSDIKSLDEIFGTIQTCYLL